MTDASAVLDELLRRVAGGSVPPPMPPPGWHGGGGDDNDPSMEARVAKLEAHLEHVRGDLAKLSTVPVELATIKTKVEHLPGKGFVVTAAVSTVGAIVALFTLLQRVGVLH